MGMYVPYSPSVGREEIAFSNSLYYPVNFLIVTRETICSLLAESSWSASWRYCVVPRDLKYYSIT